MPRLRPSQKELKAIEFRACINRYLLLRGMNKNDLSKRTGIPIATLYKRLREQDSMQIQELRRIGHTLNIPADELAKVI